MLVTFHSKDFYCKLLDHFIHFSGVPRFMKKAFTNWSFYKHHEHKIGVESLLQCRYMETSFIKPNKQKMVEKFEDSEDATSNWVMMVQDYAKNGKMDDARKLFDELPVRKPDLWVTMIAGYGRCGMVDDARQVFDKMPERCTVAWNALITSYGNNGRIPEAIDAFEFMPQRDIGSWNSLLTVYLNSGRIKEARQVFAEMPNKNFVTWNAMFAGYLKFGKVEEAHALFKKMPKRNIIVWNSMITCFVRLKRMDEARQLFDQMPKKNIGAWTVMLSGYAENGNIKESRSLFDMMPHRNSITWTSMINGYIRNGNVEEAARLFERMPSKDIVAWTSMISGFFEAGKVEEAKGLFGKMPERNNVSWNAMITGYEHNGHGELALEMFYRMQQNGMRPSQRTFASTLRACAGIASLDHGVIVHQKAMKLDFGNDLIVCNALLTMYSKCGCIGEADQIFISMPEKDCYSWNALIGAHGQHGNSDRALGLFHEMLESSCVRPDHVTFVGVLSACSHGCLVEQGCDYFERMSREWNVLPRMEHFACMVDLLRRAGMLKEAEELLGSMPFPPNANVWGALVAGCKVHGDVRIGIRAAEELLRLEPHNAGTYVLMGHLYATCGCWEELSRMKERMKVNGIKKQAGCSWIEIKNSVYAFAAGD